MRTKSITAMKKIRFNINTRMLVYLLSGATLIYLISLGAVIMQTINSTKNDTFRIVEKTAAEKANLVKSVIDSDIKAIDVLADIGSTFELATFEEWEKIFLQQQKAILKNNPQYISVATSFELKYIDSAYNNDYGRLMRGYYREGKEIKLFDAKRNLDGDNYTSNYYYIKTNKKHFISNPELFSYTGNDEDAILNTNISVPILKNNEFVGLAGADVNMDYFQSITDSIQPYQGSYAFILSADGTIVAHPTTEWVGKKLSAVDSIFTAEGNVNKQIDQGKTFTFSHKDTLMGSEYQYTFSPIKIEKANTNWALAVAFPTTIIEDRAAKFMQTGIIIGALGLIVMGFIISLIARSISRPIIKTTKILKELSNGKIDKESHLNIHTKDEVGEMAASVNQLTEGLYRTAEFASSVGDGNLNIDFQKLSDEDMLGSALLEMRDNLKQAKEDEAKRKKEEEIRRWATDGYSIINDLLRKSKDLQELSYSILSNIIKYVDAAMGAIYVLNDSEKDDTYFEMITAVAYEREKLMRDKVRPEEGLVGRCAHEKLTIHLREIPENYVNVTSGLGESNPRSLILIPLKVNEQVLGVIELVSFNEFEDYHVEFLEKAGENVASDISTTKINQRTEELLKQSQQQADELAQQEEEMRQNMEEIQATQESLKESQAKTQMIFDNIIDAIITIDSNGIIELWNPAAEKLFGYSSKEAVGQNINLIMYGEDAREHDNYIKRYLKTGQRHVLGKAREVMGMHKSGKKFPVELRLEEGQLGNETKFVGVLRDMTDLKKAQEGVEEKMQQLKELNAQTEASKQEMQLLVDGVKDVSLYVEYDMDRKIIDINNNFLNLLGTKKSDMLGVKQGAFETDPEKKKEFDKLWKDLSSGKTRKIVQHILANGKNLYFSEVYIPVRDQKGNVYKIINLAIDITDTIKKK